jgi:hypothetical protein
VKRQRKLLQPCAHLIQKAPGIRLVLEPDNEVVGVAHDDDIARGLAPSPAFGPEIERKVIRAMGSWFGLMPFSGGRSDWLEFEAAKPGFVRAIMLAAANY